MELDVVQAVLLGPGEGETITDRPGRTLRILLAHEWLVVTWAGYDAGQPGAEPHVHREHVDSFYVVKGELVLGVGPDLEEVRAPAGAFVSVPPNVVHTFRIGDEASEYLNFHTPSGGFAEYLRGRGEGFDSFDPPADGGRPAADAIVTFPGGGERFQREDRAVTILGALPEISVLRLEVEPEWPGIPTHEHETHVDTFFVLDGETGLVVGDDVAQAGPGSFYGATPGARHGVRNSGRAALLNVHGPDAGFAESVRRQ